MKLYATTDSDTSRALIQLFHDNTAGSLRGYSLRSSGATDQLEFLTSAGETKMFLDSSGNIGIATTNPNQGKLHLHQTNDAYNGGLAIQDSTSSYSSYFWTNSSGVMRLDAGSTGSRTISLNGAGTGNVGVGTTTPGYKLDVNGELNLATSVLRVAGSVGTDGQVLTSTGSSVAWEDISAGVTGSGTTNYIPKWASSTSLGNSLIYNSSNIGIGTTSPAYQFEVEDSIANSYVAKFENTSTAYGPSGVYVYIKTDGSPGTDNRYIGFGNVGDTTSGAIYANGSSAVVYSTTGGDFAEFFNTQDASLSNGEIVCVDSSHNNSVRYCNQTNDNVVGVVSSSYGFVGNQDDGDHENPNKKLVGLVGQISVKVNTQNGPIKSGDPITSSDTRGIATKATKAGTIIGRALENYSGGDVDSIKVYVNRSWYDPAISLTADGSIKIEKQDTSTDQTAQTADQSLLDQLSTLATQILDLTDQIQLLRLEVAALADEVANKTQSVFNQATTFLADVTFRSRVTFEDQDTAGFALIKEGEDTITIEFENPYEAEPVVTVTAHDKSVAYYLRGSSSGGFTIELDGPATEELKFSWMAIMVTDAITHQNEQAEASTTSPETTTAENEEPQPTPEPTPPVEVSEDTPASESASITEETNLESSPTPEPTVEPTPEPQVAGESTTATESAQTTTEN